MIQGVVMPNLTAVALDGFTKGAGSAAAVIGTLQFLVGAIIPPLVSTRGSSLALMAATMSTCLLFTLGLLVVRQRSEPHAAPQEA